METLCVVAHIRARKEKQEELKGLLMGLIAPTREEAACIRYQLFRNNQDPQEFTFLEEWTNDDALDAHLRTPHLQAALAALPDLVESPPQILRNSLIG